MINMTMTIRNKMTMTLQWQGHYKIWPTWKQWLTWQWHYAIMTVKMTFMTMKLNCWINWWPEHDILMMNNDIFEI